MHGGGGGEAGGTASQEGKAGERSGRTAVGLGAAGQEAAREVCGCFRPAKWDGRGGGTMTTETGCGFSGGAERSGWPWGGDRISLGKNFFQQGA